MAKKTIGKKVIEKSPTPAKRLKAFLKLTRFNDSLFAAFVVVASGLMSGNLTGFQSEYALGFGAFAFLLMGTFAINDYYDYQSDIKNKRVTRPLVNGIIKRETALKIAIVAYVVAILFALPLRPAAFLAFSIGAFLSALYSSHLQKVFILKNIVIAVFFTTVILFGSLLSDNYVEPIIAFFALLAFIAGFAHEVMIDIPDVVGDRQAGITTIANKWSESLAVKVAVFFYTLTVALATLPFFIMIDQSLYGDRLFLLLSFATIALFFLTARSLVSNRSQKNIWGLREQTLNIMRFVTAVYVICVLV